ncbi:MAG: hypothetical protein ABIO02_00775 [Patescibacteria group bacterium]
MDTTQLLLIIVLSISCILLTVIGIQVIFVLRDFRNTIKRVNNVVDGFESLGVGLDHGLSEVVGFFNGFKSIAKALEIVHHHKKNEKTRASA